MTDETQAAEQPITTREWARALLVVIIAAALMVGLGIWFVFSFVLTCGCTKPA